MENWLTDKLVLASATQKKTAVDHTKEFNSEDLIKKLGFTNAFVLLARCYQIASHKASLDGKDKIRAAEMATYLGTQLDAMKAHKDYEVYKPSSVLLTFRKDSVYASFIQELTTKAFNEEARRKLIQRVAIATIAFTAIGACALEYQYGYLGISEKFQESVAPRIPDVFSWFTSAPSVNPDAG